METFEAFCSETSLHGWKYISHHSKTHGFWQGCKKCFWIVTVLFAMCFGGTFLYSNTIDFMEATVVTTVDTLTVPLSEVFFPSVVVCNINQVRKSFFAELGIYDDEALVEEVYSSFILGKVPTTQKGRKIIDQYLSKHNLDLKTSKLSMKWFTHQQCEDTFVFSKWNQTKTYSFPIARDFGTDYGICCWYTPQINITEIAIHMKENNLDDPDWAHWFINIPKGAKTGKDNGFRMLFDIETFDYSYYNEGSEGLKVGLIHPLDMPIMRQVGFHLAPGTENQIAVTPTLMATTPSAMARFNPEQRDCYGEEEISLKYLPRDHGYRYEMGNCLFEAAFEKILSSCHCVPGFHMMGGDEAMKKYEICMGGNLTCMNHILNRIGEFEQVEYGGKQMKCRSACEDQVNSLFMSSSSYPNRNTFVHREEFCIIAKRIINKCKSDKRKPLDTAYPNLCTLIQPLDNTDFCPKNLWKYPKNAPVVDAVHRYAKDNLVMFNIFVKDMYAKRFMKDEKITKTGFIANSGAILCVCMGFSLVSAVEILYHCLLGLFSSIYTNKTRSKNDLQS